MINTNHVIMIIQYRPEEGAHEESIPVQDAYPFKAQSITRATFSDTLMSHLRQDTAT